MTACRWNGLSNPRIVIHRHAEECGDDQCSGCLTCHLDHCICCGKVHVEQTNVCPSCVGQVRDDLDTINVLHSRMLDEAVHRGVDSEAAMMAGPAADVEAWQHRAMSALRGRVDDAYLADCLDEDHPLLVCGTWDMEWREEFDQPTDLRITVRRATDYLAGQLDHAARHHPAFDEMAADVRRCVRRLEDVLHDGERDETGAPCVHCGTNLVRDQDSRRGLLDTWRCKRCRKTYTEDGYRYAVGVTYRHNAPALTTADLTRTYDVTAGAVRTAASRGKVTRRGHDLHGHVLYDVADVLRHTGQDKAAG